MADISCTAGHNGFRGLTTGLVDVINCARTDVSFQFDAVVPKGLRRSSLEHFSRGSPFELTDAAFSGIHPRGIGLGLSFMAISLSKLAAEVAEGLFF